MVALNALNVLPLWSLAIPTNTGISLGLRLAVRSAPTDRYSAVGPKHTYQPLGVSPFQATATAQSEVEPTQDKRASRAEPCLVAQVTSAGCVPPAMAKNTRTTEFRRFLECQRAGRAHDHVVLDLRPTPDFRREHLVGATSIPAVELEARMLELPPPFGRPVSVVGSDEELQWATNFLQGKGWHVNKAIRPNSGDEQGSFEALPTEVGSQSVQVWRANSFLEFCMERYLLPSATDNSGSKFSSAGDSSVCLDLGCGSGRDTVYMAQCMPPGTRVIGVDNHSYALERGEGLARLWVDGQDGIGGGADRSDRAGVVDRSDQGGEVWVGRLGPESSRQGDSTFTRSGGRRCEWLCVDLRKTGSLEGLRASVIHGHRFKCEQLLPVLRDEVLLPGGYFIWSTFLDTGTENLVPPWRPSRMMRPGELADIFAGDEFEILVDEAGELTTRGSVVPANFFACRKKVAVPSQN